MERVKKPMACILSAAVGAHYIGVGFRDADQKDIKGPPKAAVMPLNINSTSTAASISFVMSNSITGAEHKVDLTTEPWKGSRTIFPDV